MFHRRPLLPQRAGGKGTSLEAVQLVYDETKSAAARASPDSERSWSVATARRIQRLRRAGGVAVREAPLAVVVWDLTRMSFVDVTAVLALEELKEDIRGHCGPQVQSRVVGMAPAVRERFERAEWPLADLENWRSTGSDVLSTDVV